MLHEFIAIKFFLVGPVWLYYQKLIMNSNPYSQCYCSMFLLFFPSLRYSCSIIHSHDLYFVKIQKSYCMAHAYDVDPCRVCFLKNTCNSDHIFVLVLWKPIQKFKELYCSLPSCTSTPSVIFFWSKKQEHTAWIDDQMDRLLFRGEEEQKESRILFCNLPYLPTYNALIPKAPKFNVLVNL